MTKPFTVACYYFPNYHVDARNEVAHGPGWTEWDLVRRAEPKWPGHRQPRVPAWGYTDEADPVQMAQKIAAAADHGVDVFLFDWYWYNDGPFLQRGLDEGFLPAANADRLRFALMYANHTWTNIHPAKYSRSPGQKGPVQFPGEITRETFHTLADHVIETYFRHPSYWLLDGCPYFSWYDLGKLVTSFGGLSGAADALAWFRERTRAAGFPDLHLNAVLWGQAILPGESTPADPQRLLDGLGFDSYTSYVWVHHGAVREFPETDYAAARDRYLAYFDETDGRFRQPYHPNVTMGWDPSPRTVQSDRYENIGYPFTPTLGGNTPEAFREALRLTRDRLAGREDHRILTINAWNEWTEGSYLEPDTVTGMGYLEAIRDVFGGG